jgi:hypothetical protein
MAFLSREMGIVSSLYSIIGGISKKTLGVEVQIASN